jgi:hypothetical protein
MYLVGAPLLLIPFAIYNIIAFLMPGVAWSAPFARIVLRSGAEWTIAPGEILIAFSILILLVELVKFTRIGVRSWVDHGLALLLFAGMTAEFVLVQAVASPTFFLLLVISFVDFVGGIAVAVSLRRRDVVIDRYETAAAAAPELEAVPETKIAPQPEARLDTQSEPKVETAPSEAHPT